MKIIKFLERVSPYQPGETAGFPDEVAKSYVDGKKAEYVPSAKTGKKGTAAVTDGEANAAGGTEGAPGGTQEG
ncbi:hypothetical protein [Cupriavidus gilardii]|uniref:hypothetical protein n=1 Tax=Cupriavidus gilardii TaxID=82541 RepID=UPI0007E32927|nr:hypothetical protein [Cupriavidus gilardii]